jgi:nitrogen fixation protein NifU and related proteins
MSADACELYQELVLEHWRNPRNQRVLAHASHRARGDNPLCGDQIDVYVDLHEGVIRDISFGGIACAVAIASASLMTEALMGRAAANARGILEQFQLMLTQPRAGMAPPSEGLGALRAVHEFPSRVPCALLAWSALAAVLNASSA